MKPRTLGVIGAIFMAFGAFALMMRVLGGDELALLPLPVALIVIAAGAFFLKQGLGRNEEKHA